MKFTDKFFEDRNIKVTKITGGYFKENGIEFEDDFFKEKNIKDTMEDGIFITEKPYGVFYNEGVIKLDKACCEELLKGKEEMWKWLLKSLRYGLFRINKKDYKVCGKISDLKLLLESHGLKILGEVDGGYVYPDLGNRHKLFNAYVVNNKGRSTLYDFVQVNNEAYAVWLMDIESQERKLGKDGHLYEFGLLFD